MDRDNVYKKISYIHERKNDLRDLSNEQILTIMDYALLKIANAQREADKILLEVEKRGLFNDLLEDLHE